jgi:hypothetical protein
MYLYRCSAEVFYPDAMEVMQLLLAAMQTEAQTANDTATFDYVLPACARISKALGPQFEPFLPHVMPPVLRAATEVVEFSMVDVDAVREVCCVLRCVVCDTFSRCDALIYCYIMRCILILRLCIPM